jgi:hypothetical protein
MNSGLQMNSGLVTLIKNETVTATLPKTKAVLLPTRYSTARSQHAVTTLNTTGLDEDSGAPSLHAHDVAEGLGSIDRLRLTRSWGCDLNPPAVAAREFSS